MLRTSFARPSAPKARYLFIAKFIASQKVLWNRMDPFGQGKPPHSKTRSRRWKFFRSRNAISSCLPKFHKPTAACSFLLLALCPKTWGAVPQVQTEYAATDGGFLSMAISNSMLFPIFLVLALLLSMAFAWRARHREAIAHAHALELEAVAERMHSQAAELSEEARNVHAQSAASQHSAEQAQQFAATLIDAAALLIFGVNGDGRLRFFNQTAETVTGYTMKELDGQDWLKTLFPGLDFAPARDALGRLMRGELDRPVETLMRINGGNDRQIAWRCRQVVYCGEPLTLMLGVDLTDRAQAEHDRHELERKLLDMQKLESLGVLAGGIAHDFNNLLTAILGNAQLAKLQLGSASPVASHLIEIERTSMQAADLCKQMLAYSGQGKIEVRLLDLNRIIHDMSQLLRISVDKRVGLSFNLCHTLPLIRGDVSQIRQVFMNLIINASESIHEGEGAIWVSTGVVHGAKHIFRGTTITGQPEERDYVFVEIADTGCGMDEETKARIFDPFFTTKFTGRGLGLAAVLGIVRSHGGTLELDSHVGEGTTFTLLFPRADAKGTQEAPGEPAAFPHWSGEGLVLVVDDEESVRTLATRMLESFDFHVITACDGRDALSKFDTHAEAITAVVMDVTMPVMDGIQAMAKIREIRSDVPILFMSGYMREGELCNLDAATDFLQKPFKLEDLREKLRNLLAAKS